MSRRKQISKGIKRRRWFRLRRLFFVRRFWKLHRAAMEYANVEAAATMAAISGTGFSRVENMVKEWNRKWWPL